MNHKKMIDFSVAQTERFWASVDVGGDGCWEWQRKRNKDGYGTFTTPLPAVGGKTRRSEWRANRVAYYLAVGVDPGEQLVCHHCNNEPCCNPGHLWLGTDNDNTQHKLEQGRQVLCSSEDHPASKLTDAQVREMRKDIAQATRDHMYEYARKYDMTVSNIAAIVNRTTWLHL
jgi:hypothetical protein